MAKTLVDIDRDLVEQARKILGQPSMVATIREALRLVVAEDAHRWLVDHFADLDDEQRAALTTRTR